MKLYFPIDYVNIQIVDKLSHAVTNPVYSTPRLKINENEFSMKIDHIGNYYAQNGHDVQIQPDDTADQSSVQLFLSGSILGAILHQKGIIPFHGSSFIFEEKGIIICGHSGVGKSSVVAAFCQSGAHFINDDITPVSFPESGVHILPIRTKIKLWDDSLKKLDIPYDNLNKIRPTQEKYYVPFSSPNAGEHKLNTMVILCTHNESEYKVVKPSGIDKYNLIKRNIYRKMYLRGMPQTNQKYFQQILKLANTVDIIQVFRPNKSDVYSTMEYIKKQLLA